MGVKKNISNSRSNSYIAKAYKPDEEFKTYARINSLEQYKELYKESILNPEHFWGEVAHELHWFKHWQQVKMWNCPEAKWFVGGKTNISYNAIDRHLNDWHKNKAAILWEGEPGDSRVLTYATLHYEVERFSSVLSKLGVQKGDRVAVYMGMVPELAIALLSIARIGAVHIVVYAGYSAEALKERLKDSKAKMVITSDMVYRRGGPIFLKPAVDKALEKCKWVQHVIVLKRDKESAVDMLPGRDHWWHEVILSAESSFPAIPVDADHPLFVLYTSGTGGKPKGIIHATGGYMVSAYYSYRNVLDYREDDVYWCTADIGWGTGHTYMLYGPLLNGSTVVMYEGAPNYPDPDRFWSLIEKYKVTVFYTSPMYLKNFMQWGEHWVLKHNLSSLRLLALGGEPADPKLWLWYYKVIGKEKCPIVDAWWQTETGSIMLSTLPGAVDVKPGSSGLPLPGVIAEVVDKQGVPVKKNEIGYLIIRDTFPSMLKGIYGNKNRLKEDYFSEINGYFFTGDAAKRDEDGYFRILGRIDESISVGGKRMGTAEIETAILTNPNVADVAVVAKEDELKGNQIIAFVVLKGGIIATASLKDEIKNSVQIEIGYLARPDEIRFTEALPKTKNGKIIRRFLRDLIQGPELKDDLESLDSLREEEF